MSAEKIIRLGSSLVVGTARALAQHSRPFSSRTVVHNLTTGEWRRGPGLWSELQPVPRPALVNATVRAATTANITIATALNDGDTLDGVELETGDLVLVKDQSTGSQNGIYVVGVTPARAAAFSTFAAHAGILVEVEEGTANANLHFLNLNTTTGTLNTTVIGFRYYESQLQNTLHAASTRSPMGATDRIVVVGPDGKLTTVLASVAKTYMTA